MSGCHGINQLGLHWQADHNETGKHGAPRLHISIDGQAVSTWLEDAGVDISQDRFLCAGDVSWSTERPWRLSGQDGQKISIVLLACACGEIECGHLAVNSQCHHGFVYWRFDDPPAGPGSKELPRFCFEKQAYQAAVQQALSSLPRHR